MADTTEATVTVGNYRQDYTHPLVPGTAGERITIKAGEQEYRIWISAGGSLQITSESFTHSQLAVLPTMSNVITVKGVKP